MRNPNLRPGDALSVIGTKPLVPGDFLEANIKGLGISIADAATQIGMSEGELRGVISGTTKIDEPIADKLEALTGINSRSWQDLQQTTNYLASMEAVRPGGEPRFPSGSTCAPAS